MMEFTYNGFVRWGFGFYNPNHAAAAICAVLPFVWAWRPYRKPMFGWACVAKWLVAVALFSALALTCSRTGFVVAVLEMLAMSMSAERNARIRSVLAAVVAIAVLAAAFAFHGAAGRFAPDAAALNRPLIWKAGLELAAANQMGVGHGVSGLLVTAFMFDGIEVRTLVNSHLTLLAEQGWLVGGVWFAFIAAALLRGFRRKGKLFAVWISFAGLCLSSSASSVFDWGVLFDFAERGGLGMCNFMLSWILFASFLLMGFCLCCVHGGKIVLPVALGCLMPIALLCLPCGGAPKVRGGLVVKEGRDMALVLHGEEWSLKAVVDNLGRRHDVPDGWMLAIGAGYVPSAGRFNKVFLFGTCAESAYRFPDSEIVLVDPPEFFDALPVASPCSDETGT